MKEDKLNVDETTLEVDLSDATEAVKESRFEDAHNLLKITLKEHPDNIDSLFELSYGGSNPESIDFDASIDANDLIITIVPIPTFIEKRNVLLTVNANVLQDEIGNLIYQTNLKYKFSYKIFSF